MAVLTNSEIQKQAMDELCRDSERDAIRVARDIIECIAHEQYVIECANKKIEEYKLNLAKVSIKDFSKVVA